MGVRNKMVKGLFYVALVLFTIIQSYLLGLMFSGAVLSPVLGVWSIIKPLPSLVTDKLWLIYLLSGVPTGTAVAVYTLLDVIKARSKKHNKQDNGNQ